VYLGKKKAWAAFENGTGVPEPVWVDVSDACGQLGDDPFEAWLEAIAPVWQAELRARELRDAWAERELRAAGRTVARSETKAHRRDARTANLAKHSASYLAAIARARPELDKAAKAPSLLRLSLASGKIDLMARARDDAKSKAFMRTLDPVPAPLDALYEALERADVCADLKGFELRIRRFERPIFAFGTFCAAFAVATAAAHSRPPPSPPPPSSGTASASGQILASRPLSTNDVRDSRLLEVPVDASAHPSLASKHVRRAFALPRLYANLRARVDGCAVCYSPAHEFSFEEIGASARWSSCRSAPPASPCVDPHNPLPSPSLPFPSLPLPSLPFPLSRSRQHCEDVPAVAGPRPGPGRQPAAVVGHGTAPARPRAGRRRVEHDDPSGASGGVADDYHGRRRTRRRP